MSDYLKLQAFVEAATSNPRHPIFQLGMRHSPILQNYAVNVQMLGAVKPEQWFKDNPVHTAKLEEVMKLCEEDETERAQEAARSGADSERVKTLEAQVATLATTVERLLAAGGKPAPATTTTEAKAAGDKGAKAAKPDDDAAETEGDEDEKPFDGMEDE